ncbi:hypothetical protein CR513_36581, partial [Mucuna pruriens]
MSIFSNLLQDCMDIFMDDFTVYADSFDACLGNLSKVLTRCIDTNLVLNFEKCHFMVIEGIVLGHLVSNRGIEIDITTSLPNPTFMREVCSFLGHVGFYRRFIKNFNKIGLPLSKLLQKDVEFKFDQPCELLAIVFALEKFYSYLLGSRIIVFFNHVALRFLLKKSDAKPRLIRWMLLLQEFKIEIKDKKGAENSVADHLSRIERESNPMPIRDEFTDEQLLHINTPTPWFADICNFMRHPDYTRRNSSDAKYYIWDDPYLWRLYNDQVICRCIPDTEIKLVLQFCHAASGGDHYGSTRTACKVLGCGFYWPTIFRDIYQFVCTCEKCQKVGMTISRRHEMPQQPILFCEVFDVWGIDFMGPFPVSNGYSYIMLAVDYVSRWVEAIATKTNDAKVVVDFLKSNIFCRFAVPKALISDQGSHFCNRAMFALIHKYGVGNQRKHCKRWQIPVRRIGADSWRTLYGHIELHIGLHCGCLPTRLSSIKPIISQLKKNIELTRQSNNSTWPMTKPESKESKLRSRWDGPFVITNVFPYGEVELKDENTNNTFQVYGHQIKLFHEASRTATIRKEICGIRKHSRETLHKYWERFNKLYATCPQHHIR